MSCFFIILSVLVSSANCRTYFNYSRPGFIGNDLSILNRLRESLAVGWYGDIKYVSDEDTFLRSEGNAVKRNGGTVDPGAQPGELYFCCCFLINI